MPKGRFWTEEDERFLMDYYEQTSAKWCAKQLNRSVNSVTHRANALGLIRRGRIKEPIIVSSDGYLTIKGNGKGYRLHRLIMEWSIGRKLSSAEIVHHKDGNVLNNSLDNLEILNRSTHMQIHCEERRDPKTGKFLGDDIVRSQQ